VSALALTKFVTAPNCARLVVVTPVADLPGAFGNLLGGSAWLDRDGPRPAVLSGNAFQHSSGAEAKTGMPEITNTTATYPDEEV
jgi:hypothetical protein